MADELPYAIVLVAMYCAFTGLRLAFRRHARHGAQAPVERDPWLHRAVLWGLIGAQVGTLAIYLVRPSWLAWGALPLPGALRWGAAALGFGGVGLMAWCHVALGRSFHATALIKPDQRLVDRGPYARVRHPMYTAFAMLHLGSALLAANAALVGVWCGGLAILLALRVPREEAMLRRRFGDHYRRLERRTGRFLPRLAGGAGAQPTTASRSAVASGTGSGAQRSRSGS